MTLFIFHIWNSIVGIGIFLKIIVNFVIFNVHNFILQDITRTRFISRLLQGAERKTRRRPRLRWCVDRGAGRSPNRRPQIGSVPWGGTAPSPFLLTGAARSFRTSGIQPCSRGGVRVGTSALRIRGLVLGVGYGWEFPDSGKGTSFLYGVVCGL